MRLRALWKVVGFLDRHDEAIDHPLAVVAVDLRDIGSHDREPVDLDRALTGRSRAHVRQQRVVDIVFTVAGDVDDEAAALADEERQSGTERAADPGLAAQAVRRLAPILLRGALRIRPVDHDLGPRVELHDRHLDVAKRADHARIREQPDVGGAL